MKNYNIRKAKLIIWDLDETFWDGVLSENEITFKPEILKFIEELVTKGIMNSICSKNSFYQAKYAFINSGNKKIWDYFIFPSINWKPKGERVKNIISKAALREENVIFIDDNPANLNEAKFYCPNIMTAVPSQIKKMAEELYIVNDYDFEHTRLKQYKTLEAKVKEKESTNISNEEFLRNSKIKITIKSDCENNIERILKLISRSNQLNFTKNRVEKDVLLEQINNSNYESAYIEAQDKYGNYGICGFYTLDKVNNSLIHFLFSCRILGMGIEQFVYSRLNYPKIKINGETAVLLQKNFYPDWIELTDELDIVEQTNSVNNNINILFKGPCDLLSSLDYIDTACNIDTEFPYWNKHLAYVINHTHTAYIVQTHKLPETELVKLTKQFPYPPKEEFHTNFFDKKYDIIFLSLLTSAHSGLYMNKKNGEYVIFGFAECDITDENNWESLLSTIPENMKEKNLVMLKDFKENYTFLGNPPVEEIIKNLEYIRKNLSEKTQLIIILGSEIPTEKIQPGYKDMANKHSILNRAVEKFAENYKNITLINLTDFIKDDEDYTTCINHFSRRVYVEMAKAFANIANEKLGQEYLSVKSE